MAQRLLQGWTLYIALAALVAALHAWALFHLPSPVPAPDAAPESGFAFELLRQGERSAKLAELMQRAPGATLLAGLSFLCFAALMIGGFALTALTLWRGRLRGLLRVEPRLPSRWRLVDVGRVLALALAMLGLLPFARMGLAGLAPSLRIDTDLWSVIGMGVLDLFVVTAVLALAPARPPHRAFGLSLRAWPDSLAVGLRGYVGVFPWLIVTLIASSIAAKAAGYEAPILPIQRLLFGQQEVSVLLLTGILVCLIGPVAEEFLFRGVFYSSLSRHLPMWGAMIASGALFALAHGNNLVGLIPITLLGCLLAYVYERTGSLAGPILIHMLHNTFLLSETLVLRQLFALS
ncbi:MAG TPA: CPBP family intramembrane glutamic endopeptidase [bacterium]